MARTASPTLVAQGGVEARVVSLCWSGANSVAERFGVAQGLATELARQHEETPPIPQLVIGHSHGGNIGMLALHLLKEKGEHIRLATLATPFLENQDSKLRSSFSRLVSDLAALSPPTVGTPA